MKFSIGDTVVITGFRADNGSVGVIENIRSGRVAPYIVKILKPGPESHHKSGNRTYHAARDMELKEVVEIMKVVQVGDLVKDIINGYQGFVFDVESDGINTYVHFQRTNMTLYGNRNRNTTNRINIKNITVLQKGNCMPEERKLSTTEKLNMLLEYLGLEFETIPEEVKIVKVKKTEKKED